MRARVLLIVTLSLAGCTLEADPHETAQALGAPMASTAAATSVTNVSATLNGSANPSGLATTGWFRYSAGDPGTCSDTFGVRVPATGGTDLGSGSGSIPYYQSIAGLVPGTTYWFCAIANNSDGVGYGALQTFTTLAAPTVTTSAAFAVTSTGATLAASANPRGDSAYGFFRFGTSHPGLCDDTFGTRAPATSASDEALGAGSEAGSYTLALAGLTPATTYYTCAIARNSYGTSFGGVLSFTTPAQLPAVTTNTPALVTGGTAQLYGSANPGGAQTIGWFRYSTANPGFCNDTFGTRVPGAGGESLGSGTTSVSFSDTVLGLSAGTTYYVCAIASSSVGTAFGSVVSFTTPAAPTASTSAATGVSNVTATLNGSANPNRAATTGWFRYATSDPGTCNDTFGSRVPASGGVSLGSGNTSVAYSQALTGLSPATTHYFCAIASSSEGTAFGTVLSFTTDGPPVVTTSAASTVTSSGATLNGSANPRGDNAYGYFRYSTSSPGTCNDTFGTRLPIAAAGDVALGAGSSAVQYTLGVAGLTPATTYYTCAIARNSYGTSFGAVLSFTTPAAPPIVTTSTPSLVTGGTAQLNGMANPGGAEATGWFRYSTASPGTCNDTFGTRAPASGGSTLGAGTTSTSFSQAITGLAQGTTYYACAIASSSVGTSFGSVVSFTTPSAPTASTSSATGVTNVSATLNGSGTPNRASTTGWFRYATSDPGTCDDTFGSRAPASGGVSLGSGNTSVAYSQTLPGLSPATTYYFCAIASSSEGTGFGAVLSFTTSGPPTVTTSAPSTVTSSGATLNGSANPGGDNAYGYFRYSTSTPGTCNDTFGTRVPSTSASDRALGAGSSAVPYTYGVAGLTPATTYTTCAIARNAYGTSFGAVLSFTTPAALPIVTTTTPTLVTGGTAQLGGMVNPGGAATTAWFRYATASPGTCNDTFGTRAPASGGSSLGAGTVAISYSQAITGLAQGTTYYACAIASSSVGTSFGSVVSFTTPSAPTVSTSSATGVTNVSAILNGSAIPNRASTAGWFRYATMDPGTCNDTFGARAPATGGVFVGSGSSATPYSQSISGLSPGATYYFCAIASNAEGTAFGTVLSFTAPGPPTVITSAASSVTSSSATLNGSANPAGDSAYGYFRYSTSSPGACNDTFGTRVPSAAPGDASLGAGSSAVPYTFGVPGLTPATTYYTCAIARNSYGTSFGAVLSFTTPAAPPTVTTITPTLVTGGTAQLSGLANPGGATATGWFRYAASSPGTCNDTFGTRAPASGGSSLGAGTTSTAFSEAIAGLSQGTTYYVCAIASNPAGTAFGSVVSFTTPSAPTVSTSAATSVTEVSATLNGSANPNRASTAGWFRYATTDPGTCDDTFGSRAPVSGGVSLGSGSSSTPYLQSIGGLAPGTTYFFCAIASSSEGTAFGPVVSFTTLAAAPSVATVGATAPTGTVAMLSGSANPNGAAATGWFRYATSSPGACNDSFGTRAPASGGSSLGAGTASASFSQGITGLSRGTTYYFCAIASSSIGTAFGDVATFTTPDAPTATSEAATGVTSTGATLDGAANPHLAATTGWFRYAATDPGVCDDTFGTRAPASDGATLGAGATAVPYAEAITGLAPGATYYFCAIAANAEGMGFGEVRSVTTLAAPPTVTTSPPTAVLGGSAVLHGSAVPHGDATTGWFRYGTVDPGTCDDTFGVRAPASGGFDVGSGLDPVAYTEPLATLTAGTVYYTCAIASNSLGTSYGEVVSFSPGAIAPAVTTRVASAVGGTSATIAGSANPNGSDTVGWFRYGAVDPGVCDDAFGARAPGAGGSALGGGTSSSDYSEQLAGLEPNLTYYYCAAASNAGGAEFGQVVSFTTDPVPPVVRTVDATVEAGAVTLRGAADPRGSVTTGWFRYDSVHPAACDDAFGTRAPSDGGASLGAGRADVAFSEAVAGLAPGTYYACAIGSNAAGTAYGDPVAFTVPEPDKPAGDGCGCRTGTRGSGATTMLVAVLLLALGRRRGRIICRGDRSRPWC